MLGGRPPIESLAPRKAPQRRSRSGGDFRLAGWSLREAARAGGAAATRAATQNFTSLVGAPWRGGAGTIEAAQHLLDSMRRPSNADAGADVPAAGGVEHERPELPCQQQLDHLHNVAKNLMLTAVVDEPGAAAVITDDNPHVAELCACVRTILEHGLIGLAAAQRLGLPAQAGSPTAWRVVRQSAPALHLPSAQSVAFVCGLSAVDDDAERLRLWLRHALNDSSLVDALDALLADERTMALWYSPGAAVRHADVKTVLLTALEALKGVGFRLSVTSGEWLPAATSAASLPGSFALSERRASGGTEEREAAGEGEEGADARARRARKPKRVAEIGKVPRAPAAAATAALAAAGGASAGGADAGAAALAGAAADDDAAAPAADALPASLSTADADAWIAAAPPPPPLSISLALKAAGAAPESLDTSGGLPEWVAAEKGVADSGASGGGASGSGAAAGGVAGGCVEEAGASVDGAGAPPPGPNVAVSASPSAGQAAPPPACLGSGPSGAAAAAESLAARGAHAALLSTADESGGAPRASAGAAPMPPLGEAGTARTQSKAVHTAAATGCVARPDSQSAAAPALEPAGPSGVTAARAPVPERPHAAVSPLAAAPRDEGRVAGAPAGALRRPAAQAIPPPLPVLTAPELAVPPASPAGVGSDAGGSEGAAQRTTPTPDSAHSRAAARSQLSRGGSSSAASDQGVLTCGGGGLLLDSIPAGASRSGALARVLIASEREEGIVLRVHESAHTLSEERDADLRRHRPHREGDEGGAAAAGSDIDLTAYLVGADGGAEGFSEWFGEAGAPRPRAAGSAASAAAPPAASPRAPPPPSAGRPPAVLILKVVGSCTRADGATRPHTLYRLECQLATECRTVLRRYSSFVGLHKQLCRAFPDAGLSRKWDLRLLRAKASMGEGKLAAAVVARRTQLLREYVADLMVLPGVPHSAPLAQFLGVRLGAGGGVALGSPLAEARGAAVPAGDILADGAGGGGGGAEPAADGGDNGRSVPAHAARATSQPEAEPAGRHIKLLLDPPAPRPSDGALLAAQRGRCAGCGARIGEPPSPGGDARARARSAAAAKRGAGSAAIASLTHSMSSSVSAARSTLGGLAGALVGAPRYCEYTRQLFCHGCHAGAERALPARLVHRWDGRPARVRAARALCARALAASHLPAAAAPRLPHRCASGRRSFWM